MSSSSFMSCRLLMVAALAMSLLPAAHADPAPSVVRIGLLTPLVTISPEEGLRQGLAELGYVEGRTLIIERRRAESNDDLQTAAADLVRSKVSLIVALSTPAAMLHCPRRRRSLWSLYRVIRSAPGSRRAWRTRAPMLPGYLRCLRS